MVVRIAKPEELIARGYLATVMASGEVAFVRTLANGKQVGVRQTTIEELDGVTWNWNEFEDQRDYHGIPSRRFLNAAPGRWVMEEMVVHIAPEPPAAPTRHLCHCQTRALMMHGCKCGGI
jgi:hypothetical protein